MLTVDNKVYNNQVNQAVINQIPSGTKVLDIGCGDGTHARILHSRDIEVDGITFSAAEREKALLYSRNVYLFNLEEGLPELQENYYDVVLCSHVLEHICYPEKVLRDTRKVLKPDGLLIVALPNLMHYRSRWELIKGNFNYEENGIWDNSHFKWYTFSSGKALLVNNGYNVTYANVDGDIPLLSIFKILPRNVRKLIFNALTSISKGLFGGQLIYHAKKS